MTQEHLKSRMKLSEAARVCSTISDIPRFHKRGSKGGGGYGGILCKYGNNPGGKRQEKYTSKDKDDFNDNFKYTKYQDQDTYEELNLTYFEEDNYNEKQKYLM